MKIMIIGLSQGLEIIMAANEVENGQFIYRANYDYITSLNVP